METEPVELEDGEVIDNEPTDAFGTYNVLQRPHTVMTCDKQVKTVYSDDSDDTPESESDTDSDTPSKIVKRPKIKARRRKTQTNNKSDKYKIWCTQVQEESLTEDLVSCGVTKKKHQDRNVENYDLPRNFTSNVYNSKNNSSDDDRDSDVRTTNKRTNADRKNVKLRLGKRHSSMDIDTQKGTGRTISELSTTIESSDIDVANDIAEKLNENKDSLIKRVVDIIGAEKAIEFYKKTKEIEEDGGMMIMNGSRRRTPGGVYLYLVKNDDHVPQEKIREIFCADRKETTEKRKAEATNKRQKAINRMKSLVENGSEKDLPALLTRAEVSTQQIAEEARLRRDEGIGRNPIDSDITVSNPPPSPVTDDPDAHNEHAIMPHQVVDYSEDFLDLGADIDSMEMF
ncbi:hypothetical protein HCN44_001664 [Aphidius gifuensis]|uniref:Phosphorylated adapter RNA export protein n=1 Tax=Aphidius gifuensis TaxID=684658 RepID=A0A835CPX4_APHGI|nr:phosphorylated adapter RNA export protein [Aphidius gifuensis]KAF7992339.1 hypothetical protein HCN44_001664 [Aphidius gifuensis]